MNGPPPATLSDADADRLIFQLALLGEGGGATRDEMIGGLDELESMVITATLLYMWRNGMVLCRWGAEEGELQWCTPKQLTRDQAAKYQTFQERTA